MSLENSLIENLKTNSQARGNIKRLQTLIQLQREERVIGQKRMKELEDTVHELDLRHESLDEKVTLQRRSVQKFLIAIESSAREAADGSNLDWERAMEADALEAPRRKLLVNLSSRGLKELEVSGSGPLGRGSPRVPD